MVMTSLEARAADAMKEADQRAWHRAVTPCLRHLWVGGGKNKIGVSIIKNGVSVRDL